MVARLMPGNRALIAIGCSTLPSGDQRRFRASSSSNAASSVMAPDP